MSIIVRLMGGLGNQLFQYSVGRRMALQNKSELYLDHTFLQERGDNLGRVVRDYELDVFKIVAEPADEKLVRQIRKSIDHPIRRRIYQRFPWLFSYRIVKEKKFSYDESLNFLKGQLYLDGYWQSEKYFTSMEKDLRKELQFRSAASGQNAEVLQRLKGENAVSVHVRRGDMVHLEQAANFHGTCLPAYYYEALELIKNNSADLKLYIFSDDPQWVTSNLTFNLPTTIIDWNIGKNSFEDLRLMSNCKHHIIANSSFSWWGAWLNPSPDKIVVAPKSWFRDPAIDTKDLIPTSWRRI